MYCRDKCLIGLTETVIISTVFVVLQEGDGIKYNVIGISRGLLEYKLGDLSG